MVASCTDEWNGQGRRRRATSQLTYILVAAFAVRLAVRVIAGEDYFWTNGYDIYYRLAANLVAGKGFCLLHACAWEPPLYTLFLAISAWAGKNFWLVIVPQALLGAGTCLCAYLIGRDMFDRPTGLIAAAVTAFYPYYVMHDTALQDTGMMTFTMALSVWLLLRARRHDRVVDWFLAGLALGAIPLIRASVAPAVLIGLFWAVIWGMSGTISNRLKKAAFLVLAVVLMLGPWLIYTYRVTGAPVITSQNGLALWMGNNPYTFSHYPAESMDRSAAEARRNLSPADRAEMAQRAGDEIAESNWLWDRGLQFIVANPGHFVTSALRKIAAGFSWRLNPYRSWPVETAYFISYVPVAILGIVGMVLARRQSGTVLVALLFLSYIAVTAVFWSHTSHRSHLDVYWIVFAASVIVRFRKDAAAAPDALPTT